MAEKNGKMGISKVFKEILHLTQQRIKGKSKISPKFAYW